MYATSKDRSQLLLRQSLYSSNKYPCILQGFEASHSSNAFQDAHMLADHRPGIQDNESFLFDLSFFTLSL